ncbi:MAG: prolyl oligopeptidase family serine peptidase [Bacteroidales bacterium]|nr:prolyl oligopeptidase family serine peptidase [Bacteroidales bacterium]
MTVRTTFLHRALVALCAFVLSCGLLSGQGLSRRCEHRTVRFQKLDREYYLYIPASMKPGAALVIALHGHGGQAEDMPAALLTTADKGGFALCVPQGIIGPEGHQGWNVGYPFQKGMKSDDVAFICFLAKKLQNEFGLSRSDAFLTGMSNGGEMCYLTAMRAPETFKAIASIAGLTMEWMARDLSYRKPVHFMEVHGTEDHVSEWLGDPEDKGGWGAYLPVPVAVGRIVAANGCLYEQVEELPQKEGRHPVTLYRFTDGKPAANGGAPAEVWLYKVQGGGHSWANGDMDTFGLIWEFFSRFID